MTSRSSFGASPAVGSFYSVRYEYLPTYTIMGDLGLSRGSVDGVPLPQRFIARRETKAADASRPASFV